MADFGAEVLLQAEDFDLSQVVLIQATIRGALVRKWMRELKQAYEQVTAGIEPNPTQGVHWNSETLCKPKFVKQVKKKGKDTTDSTARTELSKRKNVGAKAGLKTSNISEQPWKMTETKPSFHFVSDVDFQSVEITRKEDNLDRSDRITHRASPVGYQDDTDILKFNSVETQTSLIEVSPDSETKSPEPNVNVLEGLDTSWKDRVKPFIDDNYEKFERTNVVNLNKEDDLHLDLDTDRDSVKSQRSRNSDKTNKDDKSDRNSFHNENVSNRSDRSHDKPHDASHDSLKSCQSVSSRKKGNDTSRSRESCKSNHSDVHVSDDNRSQRSVRSDQSEGKQSRRSVRSDKSEGKQSQRSVISEQSDEKRSRQSARSEQSEEGRYQRSARSDQSDGSRMSDQSKGNQSDTGKSQRSDKFDTQTSSTGHPKQSPSSPVDYYVPRHLSGDDFARGRQLGPGPNQDSTSLTNVTSVWDSFNSVTESQDMEIPAVLPQDPDKLRELRSNIAMELLWVQQAINSRKNYLCLKGQM